ncbi:hypothetical protein OJ996_23355 [Luteolibacter sp. GHJ8]|uniref:Restriction alleviation protein Lar n=1 Tax=Luteolibacter rhizosphaerae TaxID=2989719 RepID=A0ABT3GAN2_9BACT|nr:hypothetical protein [Luteolibacter rhizosphaerae]MCW1916544.1 hypothetical protein [Luteolibacter rhizosphaerae]
MKLGADDCPHCGNLYVFFTGGLIGVRCRAEGCQAGYVTSNVPAIYSDHVDYTCFVESLPEDWKRAVAWLANRFQIPVREVRRYRDDPSGPLVTRKAPELLGLRAELEEHGIRIRIEPEFRWTEDDIVPESGERPLNDEELRTMSEIIGEERELDRRPSEAEM